MRQAGVAADKSLRFYIEVSGQELDGCRFEVGADGVLIGRSSTCDVIFQNREISRRHCYFYWNGRFCYVQDLGSKNGILVNGRPAKEKQLADGDAVDIGPSRLVLHVEGSASPYAAGPPDAAQEAQAGVGMAAEAAVLRHPLALAALLFALLVYLHWGFGLCGVILALVALWEARRHSDRATRALAVGALTVGAIGGALNAWFTEWAPRLRQETERRGRLECRDNMAQIAAALEAYRLAHDGSNVSRLEDLVEAGLIGPERLFCPGCGHEEFATARYVFYPSKGSPTERPLDVIVSDPSPACHEKCGGWVLRNDGQPEWMPSEALARLPQQTNAVSRRGPTNRSQAPETQP